MVNNLTRESKMMRQTAAAQLQEVEEMKRPQMPSQPRGDVSKPILSRAAHEAMMEEAYKQAKRIYQNKTSKYRKFQEQYRDDRVAFAHDIIEGLEFTPYQDEIADRFNVVDRMAVRGPHGLGKTTEAAVLLLHFALVHDGESDWKVPTTASAWRQLTKYLWPEIHKWARKIRWAKVGREPFIPRLELQTLNLKLTTGEAFALTSDDHENMEGAHADKLFFIFDEAKAIPDESFDALEGAFAGGGKDGTQEAKALAISTPAEPLGRFYDIHTRAPGYDDWEVRHVTLQEAINAGRVSQHWADQRKAQWGERSSLYMNRVLGEFAASDEEGIIPLAWVDLANQRWEDWQDEIAANPSAKGVATSAGCDVGIVGDDSTIAIVFDDVKVDTLRTYPRLDVDTATMQLAGYCKGVIDSFFVPIYIDVIGIGVGVYNRLREQGLKLAVAFNAAEKSPADLHDKTNEFTFRNKRSAMWWLGRELLDPQNEHNVALPPDHKLIGELTSPHYTVMSNAVIQVESKKEIRKRIHRSTDHADSVLQALTGKRLAQAAPTQVYIIGEGYIDV